VRIRDNRLYFGDHFAGDLAREYGTPLYVYEEEVLRARCRELKNLLKRPNLAVNYSMKANANVALLEIVRSEGLRVDTMSPGEIFLAMEAGYKPAEILFIGNNVSKVEMSYAIDRGVLVSVDSISQLEYFGELKPGGEVVVRINPNIGDGHSAKVITAGRVKFGTPRDQLPELKRVAAKYGVSIIGINMHIGSLFLTPHNYLAAIEHLLEIAEGFDHLRLIDFGGGIGVPYRHTEEERFPMEEFAREFETILANWEEETGNKKVRFIIEPGRYPVAECGTLLGTVHSIKENFGTVFVGTDLGFNVLIRPELYGAYHEVVVCNNAESRDLVEVSVCGNICETGDLVAEARLLPDISLDDTLAVLDAGAYGFSMSSNYNMRLRPAEVLLQADGALRIIREREDLSYLTLNQRYGAATPAGADAVGGKSDTKGKGAKK
jgi:diaminopimelate decarboxylase